MKLNTIPLLASIAFIWAFSCSGHLRAATRPLPDIPIPKLTAREALEVVQKHESNTESDLVIAIEWCRPDLVFEPRLSDGTEWSPDKAPEEWSWYITLLDRRYFNRKDRPSDGIRVIRVRNNGEVEELGGART
jgi:hypothetical protein